MEALISIVMRTICRKSLVNSSFPKQCKNNSKGQKEKKEVKMFEVELFLFCLLFYLFTIKIKVVKKAKITREKRISIRLQ